MKRYILFLVVPMGLLVSAACSGGSTPEPTPTLVTPVPTHTPTRSPTPTPDPVWSFGPDDGELKHNDQNDRGESTQTVLIPDNVGNVYVHATMSNPDPNVFSNAIELVDVNRNTFVRARIRLMEDGYQICQTQERPTADPDDAVILYEGQCSFDSTENGENRLELVKVGRAISFWVNGDLVRKENLADSVIINGIRLATGGANHYEQPEGLTTFKGFAIEQLPDDASLESLPR